MTEAVDIRLDHLRVIRSILLEHVPSDVRVWAFGSRGKWETKDYSDLDLALQGTKKLDWKLLVRLSEAFNDSDLPYAVDIVDLNAVSDRFRTIVESQMIRFPLDFSVDTRGWRWMSLHEAAEINPYVRLDLGGEYSFVNMASVTPDVKFVSAPTVRPFKGSGSKFCSGDTLMARITPCLENGKIARYRATDDTEDPGHGSTEFIVIRGRRDVTDSDFVYYLTRSPSVRQYAISQMHGTSGRQRVPVSALKSLRVRIPPLSEQRKMASVLGRLDDKIELNQRMSTTLEEMARALFKSWFVDFDPVRAKMEGRDTGLPRHLADPFPDRMVDSELGEIPDRWTVSEIGKEVGTVGGSTPSTKETSYWHQGKYNWATPKDLSRLSSPVLLNTDRQITRAGLQKISSGLLPIGTVLLSSRAPIGYLAIAEAPTAVNQGFIAMKCDYRLPNLYVLFWSYQVLDFLRDIAGGSTFAEISKKTFRPVSVLVPSEEILRMFEGLIRPLYDRLVVNVKLAVTLTALRDTLLPKLVSGEIRVQDAERFVGAIV